MSRVSLPTTGLAIGLLASVAANVDHELIQPTIDPAGIVFGVIVALSVLVSFELLIQARKPWKSVRESLSGFLARYIGGGLVFVSAGITSYMHLNDVLHHAKEPKLIQIIGPAVIDGLMILSGWVRSESRRPIVLPADKWWDNSRKPEIRGHRMAPPGRTALPEGKEVTKGVAALSDPHSASQSVSVSSTRTRRSADVPTVLISPELTASARPVYTAMIKAELPVTVRGFNAALRANGVSVGDRKITALIRLFESEKVA